MSTFALTGVWTLTGATELLNTKINIKMCVISKSFNFYLFSANFHHYKSPRQTKLPGVFPCQKFFGQPILFTAFILSGRFYERS